MFVDLTVVLLGLLEIVGRLAHVRTWAKECMHVPLLLLFLTRLLEIVGGLAHVRLWAKECMHVPLLLLFLTSVFKRMLILRGLKLILIMHLLPMRQVIGTLACVSHLERRKRIELVIMVVARAVPIVVVLVTIVILLGGSSH